MTKQQMLKEVADVIKDSRHTPYEAEGLRLWIARTLAGRVCTAEERNDFLWELGDHFLTLKAPRRHVSTATKRKRIKAHMDLQSATTSPVVAT